jgi:hypothetical protein
MKRMLGTTMLIGMLIGFSPTASGQGDKGTKQTADPAASKLFKDARDARAVWESFPGFTAQLVVNHNGTITKAKLEVQDNGKVTLDIADADTKKFVREQVSSLVSHRLPGVTEKDTPCIFGDKDDTHPLGRKVVVLDDPTGASYRIKDNQLLEVNRDMKSVRFTITVLKNYVTLEKKYLASDYVVNTWHNKTNQLMSSWTYHHTWKRVGKFDLPETLTIVIARAGASTPAVPAAHIGKVPAPPEPTLDVWSLTFNNLDLLPWK